MPHYMTALARKLRKNPTPSEKMLWEALRERKFFGHHLRRQAPFGRYIFDIYCAKKRIAFEIDGKSHNKRKRYDNLRDAEVAGSLVTIIRFSNNEVMINLDDVLEKIHNALKTVLSPSSDKSGHVGEGNKRKV